MHNTCGFDILRAYAVHSVSVTNPFPLISELDYSASEGGVRLTPKGSVCCLNNFFSSPEAIGFRFERGGR